jgi:phosphoserine phosphatase RsbU/P
MRRKSLSIKNKILVVLATLPIFSIGLVVVMAASTFKDDKVTYVFNSVLSGAQAKSSSASSQINSFIQTLKAMTVNYDPARNKLTPNGRKYFETEGSLKGFYNFRWDGSKFNMAFDKTKEVSISDEEMEFLTPILQESWHNSVAVAPSKDYPMHLYLAAKLEGSDIAAILVESTDFFSLFAKAAQGESFLYHKTRGLIIGQKDIPELRNYLQSEIFPKDLGQQTKETMIGEDAYLMSLSRVSIGGLYVVSIVNKKSALAAVEKLTIRAVMFTLALLSILIIVGVFAANRLTLPLRNLTDATSKVMEGDFTVKVKSKSNDEIGSLAKSFNKMTAEVSRLMDKTAENARMEAELKTAQTVQETLFPPSEAKIGPIHIYGKSEPASECGGDWWYYHKSEDFVYVWIGDATGHGAPAALLTSAVRAVASVIENTPKILPSEAMRIMNRAIYATSKGQMMMTFFLGCFDLKNKSFTYSNASHDPPFYLRSEISGKPKRKDYFPLMEVNNPRLGERPETEFKDYEMKVDEGDKFIFYTDGILDVKNDQGEGWGERRFLKSLNPINEIENKDTIDSVFQLITDYRGEVHLEDDVTLILVEFEKKAA